MKKILFIPTYTYLSSPIFSNLLTQLEGYERIYLDVEEEFPSPKTTQNFKKQFDRVISLNIKYENKIFFSNIEKLLKMNNFKNRLRKIIKEESPSVVVTTSDLSLSVRVIKKYFSNIPIVIIQSAMIANTGLERSYKQYFEYIIFNKIFSLPFIRKQNYFANEYNDMFILLWGEYFKQMIYKNQHIKLIGDITFDKFPIKKILDSKKKLSKEYDFDINCNIVTICTSAFSGLIMKSTEEKLYKIYKDFILKREDLFFIIKPHPREKENRLTKFIEKGGVKNVIISDNHLHELFEYTDIHISSFSRTALEALASEIPILSINPNNEIQLEDFFNNEINEQVRNLDEMIFKIDALLRSTDEFMRLREVYIEKMLYKLDGKATERAVGIIKKELNNNE